MRLLCKKLYKEIKRASQYCIEKEKCYKKIREMKNIIELVQKVGEKEAAEQLAIGKIGYRGVRER